MRCCFHFSFDFSVSLPEVQRRTLDVAVKNSGGFLSKDKGLLGKVIFLSPLSPCILHIVELSAISIIDYIVGRESHSS